MQCPKCANSPLKSKLVKGTGITLDHCPNCGGLWFDEGELDAVLGKRADRNVQVPDFASLNDKIGCPRCDHSLFEFCYPGTMTLVDMCKKCHGIWLDNLEWKEISAARDIKNNMTCPKCSTLQTRSDSCITCGVVFSKITANQDKAGPSSQQAVAGNSGAENVRGLKGTLLRFIDKSIDALTDY